MGLKIHEYPIEAFTINDEDFYDVDFWNGSAFETRKISGATLKSYFSGANIYNSDGTLNANRTVQMGDKNLDFIGDQNNSYQITFQDTINPSNTTSVYFNISQSTFTIIDNTNLLSFYQQFVAGNAFISVVNDATNENGQVSFNAAGAGISYYDGISTSFGVFVDMNGVRINNAYRFPNVDGSGGQVLTTNGSGVASWQNPPQTSFLEVSNSAIVTTASLLVYVPHLSYVPPAGTYVVTINFEVRNSSPNQTIFAAIAKNGIIETNTPRRNWHPNANQYQWGSLQRYMTFNGTDVLQFMIAMSGGSTTTEAKSIILIKTT